VSEPPAYLYLTTTGRRSGQPREIEIWFTERDGRHYLIAEHGEKARWVQNLRADPRVRWRMGDARFEGRARVVDATAEAELHAAVRAASVAKYGWGDGLVVELAPGGVAEHYAAPGLAQRVLDGLRRAGKDPDALTPDDLAPLDQFHTGAKAATLELARLAGVGPGMDVLDVGGGLGGPARTLAATFGCRVTVLDFTEAYCEVGADLTRRTGLTDRVRFQHGDAVAPPFPDASFDLVWSQHSSMNIADKAGLYRALVRMLRPGGRLAFHEILAGPAGTPPHFPVPWARDPELSFLAPSAEIRALLAGLGLRELAWTDTSPAALEWFRQRASAVRGAPPPPVGLHLLLGADLPAMLANQVRNLDERRIAVIQAVFERARV
jgi:deazaflavin-dependent oxidoreductase (nitroreductase family)